MKKTTVILAAALILASSYLPAKEKAPNLIAITGGHIIPVVGEDIPGGTIIIRDGLIEAVGKDIPIPGGAHIIEAKGLFVYPGMIDAFCFLGLSEIGSIQATIDYRETGRLNPQVRAAEALRPDSMHIPITRTNGITASHIVPSGGFISGQTGFIRLDGRTPEEMVIKTTVAMHVEFPSLPRPGFRRPEAAPREESSKQIDELKTLLNQARAYKMRQEAAKKNLFLALPEFDEKLEALIPVAEARIPLMISVHSDRDIRAAIKFIQEEKLKAIFYGVAEGWKVADDINKSGIPVIIGSLYNMPPNWEDGYDSLFRNPGILRKAGVKLAFSSSSASLAKDLPYHAAKAAAFGLDRREALKGVTIYPAEILGEAKTMGSLEKGKVANVVLADGDILELRTNIKRVFIDGREIDLSSRYTELLEKYKKRG